MQAIFKGKYGSDNTPCEILYYDGWYCVKGSKTVNYSCTIFIDGINVEQIRDIESFYWKKPITTLKQLVIAVES